MTYLIKMKVLKAENMRSKDNGKAAFLRKKASYQSPAEQNSKSLFMNGVRPNKKDTYSSSKQTKTFSTFPCSRKKF